MASIEAVIIKVKHLLRPFLRRPMWVKLLVITFTLVGLRQIIMSQENQLPTLTLYEYYDIKSHASNEGLDDNDPDTFKLNRKNIHITSGTIHYFRIHPDYWRSSLRKLRAMGALAVETYMPWNLHEPEKDVYDFGDKNNEMSKFLDVVTFLTLAKEEDLFVILRPGPYICAEWDYGGLPSNLLGSNVQVRTSDEEYLNRVKLYFKEVFDRVGPFQVYNGGPIIMVQIENEYGALIDLEHQYMVSLKKIMVDVGFKGLFFTADSPVESGTKGSLADESVLQTANFRDNYRLELDTFRQLQKNKPLMVMEFWSGWFDHWDQPQHNTYPVAAYKEAVSAILRFNASINLYVFHGGTTFGFLNGANVDLEDDSLVYHPDTSSYDYDAVLTEAGDYTEKYFYTQELFLELHKKLNIRHPQRPPTKTRVLALTSAITHELFWPQIVDQMPPYDVENSKNFVHMEDLPNIKGQPGQGFGFIRYVQAVKFIKEKATMQIKGPIRDIVIVLIDGVRQTEMLYSKDQLTDFGFWGSSDREPILVLKTSPGLHSVEYIVENCGRVNYRKSLNGFGEKKGFGPENQVIFNGAEVQGDIQITGLPFTSKWVTSLTGWKQLRSFGEIKAPGLFKASFTISSKEKLTDTFLDIRKWLKGVVYVNGFNIGRYYAAGPQYTMYIPAPLLRVGENTIIIFEQYTVPGEIILRRDPIFV